jgi:hypothetical protein
MARIFLSADRIYMMEQWRLQNGASGQQTTVLREIEMNQKGLYSLNSQSANKSASGPIERRFIGLVVG